MISGICIASEGLQFPFDEGVKNFVYNLIRELYKKNYILALSIQGSETDKRYIRRLSTDKTFLDYSSFRSVYTVCICNSRQLTAKKSTQIICKESKSHNGCFAVCRIFISITEPYICSGPRLGTRTISKPVETALQVRLSGRSHTRWC